jgi:hypothetical protein
MASVIPESHGYPFSKRDGAPRLAALGLNKLELPANTRERLCDGDAFRLEIYIGPPKPQSLATSKSETQSDKESSLKPLAFDSLKKLRRFAKPPGFYFWPFPARSINQPGDVSGDQSVLYRLTQRITQYHEGKLNRPRREAIAELPVYELANMLRRELTETVMAEQRREVKFDVLAILLMS